MTPELAKQIDDGRIALAATYGIPEALARTYLATEVAMREESPPPHSIRELEVVLAGAAAAEAIRRLVGDGPYNDWLEDCMLLDIDVQIANP